MVVVAEAEGTVEGSVAGGSPLGVTAVINV